MLAQTSSLPSLLINWRAPVSSGRLKLRKTSSYSTTINRMMSSGESVQIKTWWNDWLLKDTQKAFHSSCSTLSMMMSSWDRLQMICRRPSRWQLISSYQRSLVRNKPTRMQKFLLTELYPRETNRWIRLKQRVASTERILIFLRNNISFKLIWQQ